MFLCTCEYVNFNVGFVSDTTTNVTAYITKIIINANLSRYAQLGIPVVTVGAVGKRTTGPHKIAAWLQVPYDKR